MTNPIPQQKPELLPCPFCEGKAKLATFDVSSKPKEVDIFHFINCRKCKSSAGSWKTEANAIAAWNKRPVAPAVSRDQIIDEMIAEASRVGIHEPLSLQDDPYIRGSIDAQQIIINALLALKTPKERG
jgi:Lar family restriction alleviation protein